MFIMHTKFQYKLSTTVEVVHRTSGTDKPTNQSCDAFKILPSNFVCRHKANPRLNVKLLLKLHINM